MLDIRICRIQPMARKPRQQRSQVTVDSLVEAGFICLTRRGARHTSTRHIAEVAGVGIGTLYDYFENKAAVFDAMNERFFADVAALINRLSPVIAPLAVEPAVCLLFDEFHAFLLADDERYLKLAQQILSIDGSHVDVVSEALQQLIMQYLLKNAAAIPADADIPALAYVTINSAIFVMLRLLTSKNPPISYEQMKHSMARLLGALK